jgi:RNA polymerase sigma factor (sigma-70 family)
VKRLEQALADDVDAGFERLVVGMQHGLYALALSLTKSHADAEDVAQEAFVRAYRALKNYDRRRILALRPRPWLAKIALNVWRNRLRGSREYASPMETERPADSREGPEARIERSDTARGLRALLETLPDRYRSAVVLRHVYELSYGEAALALRAPVGTVKSDVHRGMRMLRDAYARQLKGASA